MIEFLKGGKTLNGVKMGMTLDDLHSLLGKPTNIVGEKNYGYICYGEFRYGYTNNIIDEMAIEFKLIEKPMEFLNLEYKIYDISIFENFIIKSKSKIHEIISFINHLQLNWKAKNRIDKDSLVIKIENGPYITFYLYDGTVDKISIVDGHQND